MKDLTELDSKVKQSGWMKHINKYNQYNENEINLMSTLQLEFLEIHWI